MNHAATTIEIPQTREGWYVLHDAWYVDWGRWQQADDRDALAARRDRRALDVLRGVDDRDGARDDHICEKNHRECWR